MDAVAFSVTGFKDVEQAFITCDEIFTYQVSVVRTRYLGPGNGPDVI